MYGCPNAQVTFSTFPSSSCVQLAAKLAGAPAWRASTIDPMHALRLEQTTILRGGLQRRALEVPISRATAFVTSCAAIVQKAPSATR